MDGSRLPSPWGSSSGRAVFLCSALLVLLLLLLPVLTVTGQALTPTTPIDVFVSQTLLPLAEQALESSLTSDAKLQALEAQKKIDDAERLKEQADSERRYETLQNQAQTLQTYSDNLLKRLGDFSGSEEERYRAAGEALDKIKADAKALEMQNALLKYGMIGAVVVTVAAVIYAAVK